PALGQTNRRQTELVVRPVQGTADIMRLKRNAANDFRATRFSPDGRILAVRCLYRDGDFDRDQVRLWDLNRKETILTLPLHAHFALPYFSADSRWLAVSSTNGSVVVYDLATAQAVRTLVTSNTVRCAQFDPGDDG